MSLLACASGASVWRGFNYYIARKVTHFKRLGENKYKAQVIGSEDRVYITEIDTAHLRSSSCTCPHAAGKRIICKHMIALSFTAFPLEAARFLAEAKAWEEEEERQE